MILHGEVVSVKGDIYLPRVFAQEDETARRIAMRVVEPPAPEKIEQILEQVKREIGLALSSKQEAGCVCSLSPQSFHHHRLPGHRQDNRAENNFGGLPPPASPGRDRLDGRRQAEPAGVWRKAPGLIRAKTLHSILGLASEEDEIKRNNTQEPLSADLIIVDEFSMVDMWLANKFSHASKVEHGSFLSETRISFPV